MVRNHFFLKEAPDILPEEIVVLVEDPAGTDVHQGLGAGGLWTGRVDRLAVLLGLDVLQSGKNSEKYNQSYSS